MDASPPKNQPNPGRSVVAPDKPVPGDESAAEVRIAHERFVEVHLRVLDSAVQRSVRRVQREHRGAQRVGVRDATLPLTLGRAWRDELAVQRERRVARHLAAGQHDGDVRDVQVDVASRRFTEPRCGVSLGAAAHAEHELRWRGRQHVRRHVRRFRHRRRTQERVDGPLRFREEKRARVLLPDEVLSAERRGPGVVDVRREPRDDVERANRIHFEEDDDRGLVERHEDVLAHRELFVRVFDRHAFGTLRHRLRDGVASDGLGVLRDAERELEIVQPFEGPRPELQPAIFGAHGDRAPPDGGEEHAGSRRSAKRERRFAEREVRNRRRRGVEDGTRDGGRRARSARRRVLRQSGLHDCGRNANNTEARPESHREVIDWIASLVIGNQDNDADSIAPVAMMTTGAQRASVAFIDSTNGRSTRGAA